MKSKIEYTFEQWCLDNNRQDILDRWDDELNELNPNEISYKSNKKYWFKCPKGIHKSQLQNVQYFPDGRQQEMKCTGCSSLRQHMIDNGREEYFIKTWNKNNKIDPNIVSYKSMKEAIITCYNNPEHIYKQTVQNYYNEMKCPYCINHKIMKENSAGVVFPKIISRWSDKNKKTPYDYAPKSGVLIWWKCENEIHEDYQRTIANSSYRDFGCPICGQLNKKTTLIDLTGQKFDMLQVVSRDFSNSSNGARWFCKCDCGNIKSILSSHLLNGSITSCGCKLNKVGADNPNWKGGLTPERMRARSNVAYSKWRDEVYKKDWYTCQCCGKSKKIKKNAHHLLGFADHEELRYDTNNGITMCEDCHYTTIKGSFHNLYGTTNNTPEQLEEYINNKRNEFGIDIIFSIDDYKNGINILKPKFINTN